MSTRDPAAIGDFDLHLFGEGRHWHAQSFLGAHVIEHEGTNGVRFATWAPNARRVRVIGSFNGWAREGFDLRPLGSSGVWSIFVPDVPVGSIYKFEVTSCDGHLVQTKTDPYGRAFERRPANASVVTGITAYAWGDDAWLARRGDWQRAPMSIYEVHLGSWQRDGNGEFLDYRALANRLADHVGRLGCTHVELLPITEHPLDLSWGYQVTGFFAPTSRFGTPDDFRHFVDVLHQHDIGVLLDWVPAHFPRDGHGLARFDGGPLYEYADTRRGEHREWGTLVFDYARHEVRSFLLSSALHWIEAFHIDGLRVDAVASMLYLDYSRDDGEWAPNRHGGREHLEAVDFLREVNEVVQTAAPGAVMVAEESTAWPQVTRPPQVGGLGFSMKWNMGWMHDTLEYFAQDPLFRPGVHDKLTFAMMYAHTENFVLALSHDEVVHGKRSLLGRMPGDDWQAYANMRALFTFQFTWPGKKLLFMGAELGEVREWSEARGLDFARLEEPANAGVFAVLSALNALYREHPALHRYDFDPSQGFTWLDADDRGRSTYSFLRRDGDDGFVLVCLNLTPVPREDFVVGVPLAGRYVELFNSDDARFGGSGMGNDAPIASTREPAMDQPHRLHLTLPPLAGIVLALDTSNPAQAV